MACLFGHKWDGCRCTKCGKTRDEDHQWDLCKGKCKICGKTRQPEHDWNGCLCSRCGATRDEGHDWDGFVCKRCGKKYQQKMECKNLSQWVVVSPDNVTITGKVIPLSTVQEVIVYPIESHAPISGGCIKFVTEDNPGLPVRNGHSFEVPCAGYDSSNRPYTGMSLVQGNCFWYNCSYANECDALNEEANEIKACVEAFLETE